jgi:uncharacterized circularly permuted ATP-grasp superfamily protein
VQSRADVLASTYVDQGVTFDIGGEERSFPLDIMPRLVQPDEWDRIDESVQQRVRTLELFLDDIYSSGEVLSEGIVPPAT